MSSSLRASTLKNYDFKHFPVTVLCNFHSAQVLNQRSNFNLIAWLCQQVPS